MKKIIFTLFLVFFSVQLALAAVFVTPKGKKYHTENCRTLSRSKVIHEISKEDAIARGYTACKVCGGRDNASPSSSIKPKAIPVQQKQLETLSGKVTKVADGDTITVQAKGKNYKIRLYGIDTPENGQLYGTPAKQEVSKLLLGKEVMFIVQDTDRYGRTVAIVKELDNDIIQEHLLENGFAWLYPQYCKEAFCSDWKKLEEKARSQKIGLWKQPNAMPPWEWRKSN